MGVFDRIVARTLDSIALQLRDQDKTWNDLSIVTDIGVSANTILMAVSKLKAINAKRALANRKTQSECTERLLEMIFDTSKHFHVEATTEYNAPVASRRFQIVAGPAAGQRDFQACAMHFHNLWKSAVEARLPGFHPQAPKAKPAQQVRQTLEAGLRLSMLDMQHRSSDSGSISTPQSSAHSSAEAALTGSCLAQVPRADH